MTKLPESGELGTNTVRDHFRGSGQTSFPADYYRGGDLVPDIQQFTGSGRSSNDTGAQFQVLRLFLHDGFNSGSPPGRYTIDFDTSDEVFEDLVDGVITPVTGPALAIGEIETAITAVYPAFEFSEASHHTAQASSVEINCTTAAITSDSTRTIYLHGNFMNDAVGYVEIPDIPAGEGGVELATRIEGILKPTDLSLIHI